MAVKKIEELNIHRDVNSTEQFDVQGYLNENWDKMQDVVDNNAEELMQVQKDISTLKEDNKTNKSSIDVLEKSNEARDEKISKNVEDIGIIQETIKSDKESIDKSLENINKKDNEQDEDIKANKESIEELQAENLEIKAENERLREDIKSIATIGEASGENIHLEDSSNARCELEICGNQQQDVRIGKNKLLNDTASMTMTIKGVTFTKNDDGSVIANGTATDGINYYLSEISTTIEAGIYKLSDGVNNESPTTYFTYVDCKNEDGSAYDTGNLSTAGESSKAYSEPKLIRGRITVRKGITLSNVLFKPQLELVKSVNDVATDYEQYGASPSMNFPSEVKSVGSNVNYFDKDSVTNSLIILESGNLYPNNSWRTTDFIEVIANTYTLSWESTTDYFQCNIAFYDKDKKYLSYIQYTNRTFSNTFDIKDNAKYMRISYSVEAGETSYTREKIKLETGNKRTKYSSYNCGSAKIDIFNKNYLSKIPKTSVTAQGITSTFDGEKFICKGTAQTNYFNLFTEKVYKKISKGFKTFSTNKLKKDRAFIHFDYVDGTGQNYYTSINTNQVRFTLNKDVKSYRLNVDSITAGDTIDDNIYVQLEDGNIATEIEKAENQEYLVDVQQEMLDGDTFVRQENKWYEKHCWEKMLLNGTEKAGVSGASTNEILAIVYDINNAVDGFGYSNYFLYSPQVELNKMSVYNGGKSLRVNVSKMQFADSESFKAKLKELYEAGTPVIIYYKLAEPILLECTKAQSKVLDEIYNKAHTYKNITNISAESSEVNPIVSLKYLKDVEAEHNKLQAQIDEIKQLLSTTETSALLVNNLEKDLRMEVE